MLYLGQPAEALKVIEQANAAEIPDARWGAYLTFVSCQAYMALGQYDDAIASSQKSIAAGDWWMAHCYLAAAYAQKGEAARASSERATLEEFLPRFTIADFKASRSSGNPLYVQQTDAHLFAGLRKAGIPEK
jgi:tetratricopeptide (TPR) repeat protein